MPGGSDPYQYNAANELTASPGVSSWSYDGNGNVSSNSAGASLTYNVKNQTTAMTYGGQTLSSLVYADVDQTERTQAGSTSLASSPLGVQVGKSGTNSTFYTRDDKGNLIGERTPDGNRWYYLKDGLGSVVAVISQSGGLGNRYGYDPYGRSTSKSETVANPWQYASGYVDSTGLVKFGARYYDPNLGRWTQQDPFSGAIASPGTVDRYSYVADCPINGSDPSGRCQPFFLFLGFDTFAQGLGLAVVGGLAIAASLALEPPSFGLSTAGVIGGGITVLGGFGAALFGVYEFFHESECF